MIHDTYLIVPRYLCCKSLHCLSYHDVIGDILYVALSKLEICLLHRCSKNFIIRSRSTFSRQSKLNSLSFRYPEITREMVIASHCEVFPSIYHKHEIHNNLRHVSAMNPHRKDEDCGYFQMMSKCDLVSYSLASSNWL